MPQAVQLSPALVYVHHIVSVSSEMLFNRDGLGPSRLPRSMYPG